DQTDRNEEEPMRRVLAVLAAAACVLSIAVLAYRPVPAANVSEVLIGELLPLTGNFASLGQQYLWAGQTPEDIVNNDYPDLAVPLGPGKGFPGRGGAKMPLVVRDTQSRGEQARTIAQQLIPVNTIHSLTREATGGCRRRSRVSSSSCSTRPRRPCSRAIPSARAVCRR